MKTFVARVAIKKIKIKTMYKITHKKTGFIHYFNSKETANFVNKNGSNNYKVEEIKSFDFSNFISFIAFLIMMSTITLCFIYYATN